MQGRLPFQPLKYLRKLLCGHNEAEKRQQADYGARPEALPTQRRRALTLPSSPSTATQPNTVNPIYHQEQSRFFKIPLEIRLLVYQEVLAPSDYPKLHVTSGDGRLLSHRCFKNDPRHPGWCHSCSDQARNWDGTIIPVDRTTTYDPVGESIYPYPVRVQLLRSCRRIYLESIEVLYSQNVLSFCQSRTIVDLQRMILPQRFDSIRSLQLSVPFRGNSIRPWASNVFVGTPRSLWWKAWETIADMNSLLNLQVEITRWNDWPFEQQQDDDRYPDWNELIHHLEPMKAIRVPNFVLTLFWHVDQAELSRAVGDAAPFRVEYREHHGKC